MGAVLRGQESVRLLSSVICVLQLAEFAPALVLHGFGRVRIFLAFEPKAEPVHVALLREHAIPGLFHNVCSFRDVNHFYGLTKAR